MKKSSCRLASFLAVDLPASEASFPVLLPPSGAGRQAAGVSLQGRAPDERVQPKWTVIDAMKQETEFQDGDMGLHGWPVDAPARRDGKR